MKGLEPSTFAMARRRSSQLSYIRRQGQYSPRRAVADAATLCAMADAPVIRAARGTELRCRGWLQEAALRMLENNLDPDVAEDPANLVVYGGTGKAARTWDDFHRIVATLRGSPTTRRCWCSPGGRSACSARTRWRRAC